ncbi:MAG: hypothetical protein GY731_09025, partial [Gammaproteobacteria bacterium]|nr:hypothetical protein [Gammaproteobacteria bacterium]
MVTALGDLNTFIYQLDRADGPAQDLRETSHALNQRVQAADQLKPRNLQKACKDLEPVKSDARQAVAEAKQAIKDNTNYQRRLDKVNKALREALVAVRGLEDVDATDSTLQERYEELVTKRDDVIDIIDGHHTFLTAGYKKLDVIKSEARTVAKDARGAYADKLKDPDTRVQVEIEGMDEPVEFHPVMLPGFENLNREEREEKLAAIGEKVKKGNLLIKQLTENPGQFDNIDPTVENVADLMWALQIKAEQATGKPFSRGAMSIPDPDSKIRKFLDRCMNVKVEGTVEAYNRQSSHLTEHQEISGGSSRGIDMYDGSL